MADLSQIPLGVNPNGDPPDFVHGESLKSVILGTGITLIALSSAFVAIRLGTSLKSSRKLLLDDYLCFVGEIFGLAFWFVFWDGQVLQGVDKHSWDTPASAITPLVMKSQTTVQVTSTVAVPVAKCAILAFFLRVFGTLRWVKKFCFSFLIIISALYLAYLIGLLVYCVPKPGGAWNSELLLHCGLTSPATLAIGVCNVIIDIAMFSMPFFIITKLHIDQKRKRGLVGVFLIGFLTVLASIISLVYRVMIQKDMGDQIWNGLIINIVVATEIFLTVIVSCTPSLWSFWFNIFTKTQFYSSLRSTMWSRQKAAQSKTSLRTPKHSLDAAEGCNCEQCQHLKIPQDSLLQQSAAELNPPLPAHSAKAIRKHTVITQHVRRQDPDIEMQPGPGWSKLSSDSFEQY